MFSFYRTPVSVRWCGTSQGPSKQLSGAIICVQSAFDISKDGDPQLLWVTHCSGSTLFSKNLEVAFPVLQFMPIASYCMAGGQWERSSSIIFTLACPTGARIYTCKNDCPSSPKPSLFQTLIHLFFQFLNYLPVPYWICSSMSLFFPLLEVLTWRDVEGQDHLF